jgi:hypothetical protein
MPDALDRGIAAVPRDRRDARTHGSSARGHRAAPQPRVGRDDRGRSTPVIDGEALRERGIVYCGTGGALHNTCRADLGIDPRVRASSAARRSNVKNGGWMLTVGSDLFGHTLGLVRPRVGSAGLFANVGQAFG